MEKNYKNLKIPIGLLLDAKAVEIVTAHIAKARLVSVVVESWPDDDMLYRVLDALKVAGFNPKTQLYNFAPAHPLTD